MAGEGSIFQRADGKWVAALSIGGRTNRRYARRIRHTRRDAVAALEEMKADRRAGVSPSKQSLGAYLRWWLDETARPSVSANTYRGYEDVIAHLQPLAEVPIRDLTAEDLERVFNRMTAQRGNQVRPASPKTVRNAQLMVRSALQVAVDRGHLGRNVARSVKLRKVPRRKVDALTPERARAILDAVRGDRFEASYALGLVALRASEILGLAWEDVDLEAGTLTIRYQLVGSGPSARRDDAKTAESEATIRLPPFVVSRLREHLERQRSERPIAPIDGGLVFVTTRGYAVNGSWWTKHFQALLAAAGLPRMHPHLLRHGAATLLVDAGVHPRVVQEALRHAPGSRVTMERYAHVTASRASEAIDVLENVISGGAR
jgi:integrase